MNITTLIDKFESCCKKIRLNESMDVYRLSQDAAEGVILHADEMGKLYYWSTMTPYTTDDVTEVVCDETDSTVRLNMANGDWLTLCELGDVAQINGTIYEIDDIERQYFAMTGCRLQQPLSSAEEILAKMEHCLQKTGLDRYFSVGEEAGKVGISFIDGHLTVNEVETHYTADDLYVMEYNNSEFSESYIELVWKDESSLALTFNADSGTAICEGYLHYGSWAAVFCRNEELFRWYNILRRLQKAGQLGKEFGVVDGELLLYSGSEKTVVIPEGVAAIAPLTFDLCHMEEVVFPSTLKAVGSAAFHRCRDLQKVTCNENLERIGSAAFAGCVNLQTVILPEKVRSIQPAKEVDDPGYLLKFPKRLIIADNAFAGTKFEKELL